MKEYQSKQEERRSKRREKRKIILIGCEGNNKTERTYFSSFNNVQKEYIVRFSCGNDTDLANILRNIKKSEKEFGFDSTMDKSFAVFDVDADSNKIKTFDKLKKQKEYQNIKFIPSNPCFELWYLLHFIYTTKAYNSNAELINELSKYIKEYDKSKDYFMLLFQNIEKAIKNNKNLIKNIHENTDAKQLDNSYTYVFEIVEILYQSFVKLK